MYTAEMAAGTIIITVAFFGFLFGAVGMTGFLVFRAAVFLHILFVTALFRALRRQGLLRQNKNTQTENQQDYFQRTRHYFAKLIHLLQLKNSALNFLN